MTNKVTKNKLEPVIILGEKAVGGAYVLRLAISQKLAVRFGRFQQGNAIDVPAGEYLYVGSAMRGLGARLLRHASRVDADRPQPVRDVMESLFLAAGLVKRKRPYSPKRLHWHIDYLLERNEVALTQVIVLRSPVRLETAVAQHLLNDPATFIIAPGLGAADDPGSTHLMGVQADESWWQTLPQKLRLLAD
jgi:Uri superfamily endonuclease